MSRFNARIGAMIGVVICFSQPTLASSIEDSLIEPTRIEHVLLSRNGTDVFYVLRKGNEAWLVLKQVHRRPQHLMELSSDVRNFQISNEGRFVLLLKRGNGAGPSLELFNSTNRTVNKIDLADRIAGFGASGNDGFKVLTQNADFHMNLLTLDFSTGQTARSTDLGEVEDVGFGIDGNVHIVKTADGNWNAFPTLPGAKGFSAGGLGAFVSVTSDGTLGIFAMRNKAELANFELVSIPSGSRSLLETSFHGDVGRLLQSPVDGGIDGYVRDGKRREWVVFKSHLRNPIEFASKKVGILPYVLGRSDNDRVWLVEFEDTSEPPVFYRYDISQKSLERVYLETEPSRYLFVPPPIVHRETTADGFTIESWASPPSPSACDSKRIKCPFVVKLHGGPHHKDGHEYDSEARWLQALGFWVLRVNFRGSTGFGERFANASDHEWGGQVISDIRSGLSWLKSFKGVDANQGIALGSSFGGFAAIALAKQDPDAVACVASLNGGGDLMSFASLVPQRRPEMTDDIHKEVGDPAIPAERDEIERQSPLSTAEKSNVKYLIEYGLQDRVSPPEESSNFVDALRSNGKFLEVRYENEGHDLASESSRRFHYTALGRFLDLCRGRAARDWKTIEVSGVKVTGESSILQIANGAR